MLNSGMILSSSNYDIKAPKGNISIERKKMYMNEFILVETPPPEPAPVEIPVEDKLEDKKKEAAAKGKKKGKTTEVEAPPVVSFLF